MTEDTKVSFEETHEGRRLRVVLDGGKGNIIDTQLAAELARVLREEVDGRHLRCVTLEAVGNNFSFGASVQEHSPAQATYLIERLHSVIVHLIEIDLPVLVAVRGRCLGGGLEVVLPCQRIVASPDAHLGQPEITLGMFAPAASVLLPERVGRGKAEDLLLTGRIVDAQEALEMGLVDEVAVEPEAALVEWFETHLLTKSAMAIRFATRAARASLRPRVHRALSQVEHIFLEDLLETEDAREGIASFVEKRPPVWSDA